MGKDVLLDEGAGEKVGGPSVGGGVVGNGVTMNVGLDDDVGFGDNVGEEVGHLHPEELSQFSLAVSL